MDNIIGTAGNDVINGIQYTDSAVNSTYTTSDVIAGGAGTDTFNITVQNQAGSAHGAVSLSAANVTGVETLNVRALSTTATDVLTVNASNFPGVTGVNADRSLSAVTVTNLAAGSSAGIIGNGAVVNAALNFGYATSASAATLNVADGARGGNVAVTSTPAAVTVNSTGASNTVGTIALGGAATALTVNAASNLTTGNITGFTGTAATITVAGSAPGTASGAAVTLGTLEATTVASVNASGLTAGGISLTNNANTSLVVTGGSGNDFITAGTALVTGSVNAGAGTDRLIVTANGVVNNATNAGKFTNFEQIQANDTVTDIDMDFFAGATAVRINDGAGSVTVFDLSAAQASAVTVSATNLAGLPVAGTTNTGITIGVKNAPAGGQIDTLKATLTTTTGTTTLSAQNIDLSGITLAGVEKLELTGSGAVTATTGAVYLDLASATAVDSIIFSNAGNGNIINVGASLSPNMNVNASAATGSTIINATAYNSTTGATLAGGSGADTIYGSARIDNIIGGAGNDLIYGDGATLVQEVQTITFTATGTTAGTITVGGVAVTIVDGSTITTSAAAIVTAKAAIIAANSNIQDITATGGVASITYKATAGNVATITGVLAGVTNQTAAVGVSTEGATTIIGNVVADILTGGDGRDTFHFAPVVTTNTVANSDTITDLNLGTAASSGQVDLIVLDLATAGTTTAPVIVTLTAAQATSVAGAASLAAAVDAVLLIASTVNLTTQFTYGNDSYLLVNGATANAAFTAAEDVLIKITGVTGTLDASDISII